MCLESTRQAQLLRLTLQLLLLCLGATGSPSGTQCTPAPGRDETCVCQTDDGGIIDLTPLSNSNGKPRFSMLQDNNDKQLKYSYNPCRTFHDVGKCSDVFICQYIDDGAQTENLAPSLSEEMWIEEDGTPYVYYSNPNNQNRESKVYLNCNDGVGLEDTMAVADGEIKERLHYFFNISSCQVCPGGCHGQDSGIIGIIGLVLILVAILAIITYFVAGVLINIFYRKVSGTDIIPNKTLWFQFPFLIKDGFLFTFGPCYRLIRLKTGGYSQPA